MCSEIDFKNNIFVMEFDIEITSDTLKLHQKFEGDVGCVVWDAAIVLAKYLEVLYKDRNCLKGSNVVEIGSEIGCVGITAACLGLVVCFGFVCLKTRIFQS